MGCLGDSLHSVFQDTLVIKHLASQVEGQSFHDNIGQCLNNDDQGMRYDFPRSSIPLWSQPVTGRLVTLPPRKGVVEHKCFPLPTHTPYCCPVDKSRKKLPIFKNRKDGHSCLKSWLENHGKPSSIEEEHAGWQVVLALMETISEERALEM